MDTCDKCGASIQFRIIKGRTTPLHDGGRCSGRGSYSTQAARIAEEFCCARPCPDCARMVFYVRHNGGEAWFDELGWPWPKHECRASQFSHQARFESKASAFLGIVLSIEVDPHKFENKIRVRLHDERDVNYFFHYPHPHIQILRSADLVVVEAQRLGLLHPLAIARYVANRPFAFPMPILACCFCSSTFNSRLALERHVRRNHCHWEL